MKSIPQASKALSLNLRNFGLVCAGAALCASARAGPKHCSRRHHAGVEHPGGAGLRVDSQRDRTLRCRGQRRTDSGIRFSLQGLRTDDGQQRKDPGHDGIERYLHIQACIQRSHRRRGFRLEHQELRRRTVRQSVGRRSRPLAVQTSTFPFRERMPATATNFAMRCSLPACLRPAHSPIKATSS